MEFPYNTNVAPYTILKNVLLMPEIRKVGSERADTLTAYICGHRVHLTKNDTINFGILPEQKWDLQVTTKICGEDWRAIPIQKTREAPKAIEIKVGMVIQDVTLIPTGRKIGLTMVGYAYGTSFFASLDEIETKKALPEETWDLEVIRKTSAKVWQVKLLKNSAHTVKIEALKTGTKFNNVIFRRIKKRVPKSGLYKLVAYYPEGIEFHPGNAEIKRVKAKPYVPYNIVLNCCSGDNKWDVLFN